MHGIIIDDARGRRMIAIRFVRAAWLFAVIFWRYAGLLLLRWIWPSAATSARWDRAHRKNAKRLYRGCVNLRGVYIKLGQVLSIMGTFLPSAYAEELEGLQDQVPAQPYRVIAKAFHLAFGKQPDDVFASFARVPIAAASLGQVHEARDADGRRLAVKVLYPNIAAIIRVDLRVLWWVLQVYKRFVPVQQIERVHAQLTDLLERETDLANEARCNQRMRADFIDDPDVLFPEVIETWSTKTILTMTYMDGVKVSKKDALAGLGLDPTAVATKVTEVFYRQLFVHRFFHADPHPGNFFVQRGPEGQVRLVVLDLGAATAVLPHLAEGMLSILQGLVMRKDAMVLAGVEKMGFVAESGDRALLERTTKQYFEKLLNLQITDFSNIRGQAAAQFIDPGLRREELRNLMKSVSYPDGWFYVERAVLIVFGLSAQLAPTLNMIHVGLPHVMKFLAAGATPQLKLV